MELNIGWVMIIISLVLLVVEASQPGFFREKGVPETSR
jgi:hypothetical protein